MHHHNCFRLYYNTHDHEDPKGGTAPAGRKYVMSVSPRVKGAGASDGNPRHQSAANLACNHAAVNDDLSAISCNVSLCARPSSDVENEQSNAQR